MPPATSSAASTRSSLRWRMRRSRRRISTTAANCRPRMSQGTKGATADGTRAALEGCAGSPPEVVRVQAVIFDVDGTLVDTVDLHAESWAATFRHFGHAVAVADVRAQIGKGGDQLMPVFLDEAMVERDGEEMEAFRKDLYMREMIGRARAFPGVADLFRRIRADGRRVVLASSGKPDELAHYKKLAGIEDLVDAETTSADAEKSKPHPDIFLAALDGLPAT